MNDELKPLDQSEVFEQNQLKGAEAIKKMGGLAEAGRTLTERFRSRGIRHKVDPSKIWAWLNRDKRGIPLEYLEDVEEESGIPREELRGDVPWHELRL